jgi:hypothetical protein
VTRLARRTLGVGIAALLLLALVPGARAERGADRLERFRDLARTRLGLADVVDPDNPAEAYREIYALLDDEIVESLASGGVFASPEFLQDRLDAFGEAWGGAQIRLARVGRVVVGAFKLSENGSGNSVRVYGRLRDEAALLATMYRDGRPTVHPQPAVEGDPQFVAAWEGGVSGRGTRPLRLDLVRVHGAGARVTWSTASAFPEGLFVRAWSLRGADLRLRYELHYPGWAPGCEGQTEQEDVYRIAPAQSTVTRVSRHEHNAWHRELRAVVDRFFGALAPRDEPALAAVVPDRELRARLPALTPEPACDAADGGRDVVSIAATAEDRRPWTVTFRRVGGRWRLTAASPVLQ